MSKLLRSTLCMAALGVTVLLRAQAPQAPAPTPGEKTAEQVFKNIKVFNGKPASEVQPTMTFIAAALGVQCNYCHDTTAFEADTKNEKTTAREMITMVFDINKNSFNGRNQVNCYTCHQGHSQPRGNLASVGADPPSATPPAPVPAAQRPAVQAVLDKYIQALGGQTALDGLKSETITAMRTDGQNSVSETVTRAAGGMMLQTDTAPGGTMRSGSDGTAFWSGSAAGGSRPPSVDTEAVLHADAELYGGAAIKAQGTQTAQSSLVAGKPAWVVTVRGTAGVGRYYFDAESGLLVRYVTSVPTLLGALPVQIDYSDYKPVDGVQMPYTVKFSNATRAWTRTVSAIKVNAPVDAATFAAPKN